jgi:hypothetical protein
MKNGEKKHYRGKEKKYRKEEKYLKSNGQIY